MDKRVSVEARRLSVAPMMDWTDRHCRSFHRCLTRRTRLYTEMLTTGAVLHGDPERLLAFDPLEHPVALQLGGSEPAELAAAAAVAVRAGYDEINLNVGCPSDRVQSGRFGACLMREPALVAEGVAAMRAAVDAPVTVKTRLGVDDQDPQVALFALVDACATQGVETFIVHARKAWLQGLSPKENREIPPLDYGLAARLKRERPHLEIILNGGVADIQAARAHLEIFDGVMLGRAAYHSPAILGAADRIIFCEATADVTPAEAVRRFRPYIARALERGVRLGSMTRHMLGLFHGAPGARSWRRILTVEGVKPGAGLEVVDRAMEAVASNPLADDPELLRANA